MSEKKKLLFMGIHRPQRSPSQRFRFEQFQSYLQKTYDITYFYLINAREDKRFYAKGYILSKTWILCKSLFMLSWVWFKAKKYDVVFVQREAIMLGTVFFEKKIAQKTKMVFDFDDSIWLQNVSEANRALGFLKDPQKTAKLISIADLVLAGNQYLLNYALQFNSNSICFPTVVDTDKYTPVNKTSGPVCIGWSGSFSTVPYFKMVELVLERLKDTYRDKLSFALIGDETYSNEKLGLKGQVWTDETEVDLLSKFDIGIMPLPDDEWTKGKCALKALLYMSMGIPAVVSDVGVNAEVVEHGVNGFLCRSMDDWFRSLSILIDDVLKRESMGERGRKFVVDSYSVAAWQEKLVNELDQLSLQ